MCLALAGSRPPQRPGDRAQAGGTLAHQLLGWPGGFGTVCLAGVEGTGSYGAGLARYFTAAGVRVVEAGRADRPCRADPDEQPGPRPGLDRPR